MSMPAAIITGAGRGIGRATALALDEAGYGLALVSRTLADLHETQAMLKGEHLVITADVSQAEDCERAIESAAKAFGGIDALVHCAGLAPVVSIADMSPEQWRQVIETNLSSAFYLCHAAWPIFASRGRGVVVLVSSEASRDPFPGFAAYGSAKAGLNLFGFMAAREGDALGIRVHVISPGAVETQMLRGIVSPEQLPPDEALSPAAVARTIALCVRGDLQYTSGEVIHLHRRPSR